ncbi:MAG: BatA and WFA domain-containing protein, partial [Spirochaetota bacterium]|nr:BatA and WFA domain-containing protein [Spirochaetota bacterium]
MNILPGFASIFWFGVLAIIPFAIHFYKKWKRRKVLFAPIFLYKEEMRQAKKSVRLKSNLISILRALVLILLIILLAKPLTSEEYLSWAQNKDKTAVTLVLIDNSKSMDYYTHNETVYQKAIRLTEKLIKELPSDNTILLIELASQLSQPYNVSTDREKLIKRLRFSR